MKVSPWIRREPLASAVAELQELLGAPNYAKVDDGVVFTRGDLAGTVYVHAPSSLDMPLVTDVEVALGLHEGPDHALVYISTWQAAHKAVGRYNVSAPNGPSTMLEDFRSFVFPYLAQVDGASGLVDALLDGAFPVPRGAVPAQSVTAAWRVATEAHLPSTYSERAVELVSSRAWDKTSAEHLKWFGDRFGMPIGEVRRTKRWPLAGGR